MPSRPSGKLVVLAATMGALASAPPTQKWVGPVTLMPGGGTTQTTIYYGPWQCRQEWLTDCTARCGRQGHRSMGCIWLADMKTEVKTRFLLMPISWGGKLAITHCCCDWPETRPVNRDEWEKGRERYRKDWEKEFGEWPTIDGKRAWPGHHIRDLLHGGDQMSKDNVFPAPPDVHKLYDQVYRECYGSAHRWSQAGPDYPYAD
ncbi:MAG TPA: hypothetical protein VFU03_06825 [Gemmatimonadales bacterium]|nr:hypothetical protein [Gemmatimonadales bacterium]